MSATTLHQMFEFDSDTVSKLDFAKVTHAKVAALIQMQVLLLDEVSLSSMLLPRFAAQRAMFKKVVLLGCNLSAFREQHACLGFYAGPCVFH